MMLCEVVLSSLWFLFVIFWVETVSVWLFLSMFHQDMTFYQWGGGDGMLSNDPGNSTGIFRRDNHIYVRMQT